MEEGGEAEAEEEAEEGRRKGRVYLLTQAVGWEALTEGAEGAKLLLTSYCQREQATLSSLSREKVG